MKNIRFAHLADLHLGGWREKTLTNLNLKTFQLAINKVIELKPDFALFAGDIFNNAIPPIELVEKVVKELMKLKANDIPLYVIGGSHDYSNSGKSFITLLESAGVFIDVCKYELVGKNEVRLQFTKDKSGANISGILGRKNGLDKNLYANLNKTTLSKDTFNLFLFHTTLNDFKPDFMKAVKTEVTKSYLPQGFDYYAGGHIHTHMEGDYSTGILSYPGPLFPNNFSELKRETPSFNICEFDFTSRKTKIERVFINTYEKEHVKIEIDNLNAIDARSKIEDEISKVDIQGKILLLEISGIVEGKISDIKLNNIISSCYESGALVILKNTYKLTTQTLSTENIEIAENTNEIEENIIDEFLKESSNKDIEKHLVKALLKLELSKQEGEKNSQFEERVTVALQKSLNTLKD